MHDRELDVLFEDNHLLVVNKPAETATMGLPDGEETLLTVAKEYIAHRYHKPGKVYLGVVSRLDFPVSGVVVFARTSKAAARLNDQFRDHTVVRIYH
ncbi:MAG: pseudouridine synthase, partial [Planctomycetaceae bacterium]|nr:pseudouridine synthase [Planctomycetaceae bacterium]